MRIRYWISVLLLGWMCGGFALTLKSGHPQEYTVQAGDTLWSIAEKFLDTPWAWSRLFPEESALHEGDVLKLHLTDGEPRLYLHRSGVTYLTPKTHRHTVEHTISVIPLRTIRPFLSESHVFQKGELEKMPYVLGFQGEHLAGLTQHQFYARSIPQKTLRYYHVFRKGRVFHDIPHGKPLGVEGVYIGRAQLLKAGMPSTLELLSQKQEITSGDRLYPEALSPGLHNIGLLIPKKDFHARLIASLDTMENISQFDNVVVNLGQSSGIRVGDVLEIYQEPKTYRDPIKGSVLHSNNFPKQHLGYALIYRLFDKVSYALVLSSKQSMQVGVSLRTPLGALSDR